MPPPKNKLHLLPKSYQDILHLLWIGHIKNITRTNYTFVSPATFKASYRQKHQPIQNLLSVSNLLYFIPGTDSDELLTRKWVDKGGTKLESS